MQRNEEQSNKSKMNAINIRRIKLKVKKERHEKKIELYKLKKRISFGLISGVWNIVSKSAIFPSRAAEKRVGLTFLLIP